MEDVSGQSPLQLVGIDAPRFQVQAVPGGQMQGGQSQLGNTEVNTLRPRDFTQFPNHGIDELQQTGQLIANSFNKNDDYMKQNIADINSGLDAAGRAMVSRQDSAAMIAQAQASKAANLAKGYEAIGQAGQQFVQNQLAFQGQKAEQYKAMTELKTEQAVSAYKLRSQDQLARAQEEIDELQLNNTIPQFGTDYYKQKVLEIIHKPEYANLDPTDVKNLIESSFQPAKDYIKQNNDRMYEVNQQIMSQYRAQATAQYQGLAAGAIAQLGSPFADKTQALKDFQDVISKVSSDQTLDTWGKIAVTSTLYQSAADAAKGDAGKLQEIRDNQAKYTQYLATEQLAQSYLSAGKDGKGNSFSKIDYDRMTHSAAMAAGLGPDFKPEDPLSNQDYAKSILQQQQDIRDLGNKGIITNEMLHAVDQTILPQLTWEIYNNDPAAQTFLQSDIWKQNNTVKAAVAQADQLRQYREWVPTQQQKIGDLMTEKAKIQASTGDDLVRLMLNNQTLQNMLLAQGALPTGPDGKPITIPGLLSDQQKQQIINLEGQTLGALDNQVRDAQTEMDRRAQLMKNMGFYGTDQDIDARMKQHALSNQDFIKKMQDTLAPPPGNQLGVPSPFDKGGSAQNKYTSELTPTTSALQGKAVNLYSTTIGVTPDNPNGVKAVIPFLPNANVTFTTAYGQHRAIPGIDPVGGLTHAGVDVAAPAGTQVVSYTYGKIVHAGWYDGYGYTVDLVDRAGMLHRFAHLDGSLNVHPGDVVGAGQPLGTVGEPHPGELSTGPHLDWEVRKYFVPANGSNPSGDARNFGFDGTVNPLSYVATAGAVDTVAPGPRGDMSGWQAPNNPFIQHPKIPKNAVYYGAGLYVLNGKVYALQNALAQGVDIQNATSNTRPLDMGFDRGGGFAGKNDLDADYSYSWLRRNPAFRQALNRTANNLGIPGQWLADVIDSECNGQPTASNSSGYGGLIGFGDADAKQWGLTKEELWSMPPERQMVYVQKYLEQFNPKDLQKGIAWVKGAIWGGQGLVSALNSGDPTRISAASYDKALNLNMYGWMKSFDKSHNRSYTLPGLY